MKPITTKIYIDTIINEIEDLIIEQYPSTILNIILNQLYIPLLNYNITNTSVLKRTMKDIYPNIHTT